MTTHHTLAEILSQPEAWSSALDTLQSQTTALRSLYREAACETVIFTGCGSTYYLALAAAALMQEQTGVYSRALPASEIWLYPRSSYRTDRRTLLVAVSRSGETTETLRAVESFRKEARGIVVTLSCYPGKALAEMGDLNLVVISGQEQSIVQTRAFSALYLAATFMAGIWSDSIHLVEELVRLPEYGRQLLDNYRELVRELGRRPDLDRFYFLGSGPRYGLASELSLKMKEMSLSHSEPFHFLEFRHGPQSMVSGNTLVIGLLSRSNHLPENAVLEEMSYRGAHVFSMGERGVPVTFAATLSEAAGNVLYLPIGQLLAYERAVHRGLDPDHPHNLEAVVRLEESG
jgi:glucosamine--fructose-6-phosphate aminotransferase (isomerizing)